MDMNVSGATRKPGLGVTFINVFTSPREAFSALAECPVVLWPVLAVVLGNALLVFLYYLEVDFVWMIQTSLEAAGQELTPGLAEASAGSMGERGTVTGALAAAGTAVFLLILLLLMAGYLSFVSMFTNDGVPFKGWFSLVAWASLPTLLDVVAGIVNLALNDFTHRLPTEISVLSFGNLLGVDPAATGFLARLVQQMSITSIWSLALMVLGYGMWTGKRVGKSFAIVAAPLLLLLGIGIVLAAL